MFVCVMHVGASVGVVFAFVTVTLMYDCRFVFYMSCVCNCCVCVANYALANLALVNVAAANVALANSL